VGNNFAVLLPPFFHDAFDMLGVHFLELLKEEDVLAIFPFFSLQVLTLAASHEPEPKCGACQMEKAYKKETQ
jgi:hypothetical protein